MNIPNKLTVARIIATPVFMATMMIDFPYRYLVSLILFAAAAVTDFIDGRMARSRNIVTNFGKFLDPLADKMLTTAAFLGFAATGVGMGMTIILFITLFREFLVSSLRLVTVSSDGRVVAANIWGKAKTVVQMVSIFLGLLVKALAEQGAIGADTEEVLLAVVSVLLWLGAALCVISGIIYLIDCREYINPEK